MGWHAPGCLHWRDEHSFGTSFFGAFLRFLRQRRAAAGGGVMDGAHRAAQAGLPAHWLRPDWPAPAQVHALCTTREGGVSAAPFDSLNLGDHVVHGTHVLDLHADLPPRLCADACATAAPRLACTIMVADCLPVLLTNRQGNAVAAAHAGWRGLAGVEGVGVLETVFQRLSALAQSQQAPAAIKHEVKGPAPATLGTAAETLVWLGPCIGPQAFEVGAEVRAVFCAHDPAAAPHFVPHGPGKYLADLAALARQRLRALGVTQVYGNDSSAAWCTVSNPSRFFSHRRDSAALGGSGRFAACIWRS